MSEIRDTAVQVIAIAWSSWVSWLPVWQSGLVEDPVDAGLLCLSVSCYAVVVFLLVDQ
jgi:hypothetical protein